MFNTNEFEQPMNDLNNFLNTVATMRAAQRQYDLCKRKIYNDKREHMEREVDGILKEHYTGSRPISVPFNIQLSHDAEVAKRNLQRKKSYENQLRP